MNNAFWPAYFVFWVVSMQTGKTKNGFRAFAHGNKALVSGGLTKSEFFGKIFKNAVDEKSFLSRL